MQAQRSRFPSTRSWLIAGSVALAGLTVAVVSAVGGPLAALALVALVIGALLFVYAPGVLFGLYLLIPFYKAALVDVLPIDLTLMLAVANALQIVPLAFDRQPRAISRWGLVLWIGLLALIIFGVLYAPDQSLAMSRVMNWVLLVCLPISAAALRVGSNPVFVRQLLWTFLGMGVTVVLIGLSMLSGTDRVEVFGANTIAVSRAALLVPLMAGLFALRTRFTLVRLTLFILIPASFVVAIGSGSRGPILMLGVVVIVAVIGFIFGRRRVAMRPSRGLVVLGLASIVVLAVTASQIPAQSLARFGFLLDFVEAGGATTGVDDSALTRVYLYDAAFALFEEHTFIGAGTAGFASLGLHEIGVDNRDGYPHNAALQFAAEYGLLGLGIFGALVALALCRVLPDDASRALRLVLLFFVLNAMLSGDVFEDRTLFGLLMLILLVDMRSTAPTHTASDAATIGTADPWTQGRPDTTPSAI